MPSLSRWDSSLNTGVAGIDTEHQKLFNMLKMLEDAHQVGFGASVVSGIMDELCDYTSHHFSNEEQQLEQFGHSQLQEHKAIHQTLLDKVISYRQKLVATNDRESLVAEVGAFLQNWLVQHILEVDIPALQGSRKGS
ncbi:MAG: hemerythrin family protein [Magnetococcales bacterium]|nr:hemerythrin family protein [Magnetococcales bacterium]